MCWIASLLVVLYVRLRGGARVGVAELENLGAHLVTQVTTFISQSVSHFKSQLESLSSHYLSLWKTSHRIVSVRPSASSTSVHLLFCCCSGGGGGGGGGVQCGPVAEYIPFWKRFHGTSEYKIWLIALLFHRAILSFVTYYTYIRCRSTSNL